MVKSLSAPASADKSRYRKTVLDSVRFALSLLTSEDLRYPRVVITGGAAMVLCDPDLYEVVKTYDVDVLVEPPEDMPRVRSALVRYERAHPSEVEVEIFPEAVRLRPLRGDLMPVDFVCTYRPRIQELFERAYSNAIATDAIDEIGGTKIHCTRLEDAIICKLVFGRKKDLSTVRQVLSQLGGRLNLEYLHRVAAEYNLPLPE